ncbi:MAG: hypothetical protein H6578_11060 [Chitinophagales bacterium]|nr:hypothetical protein [Chitinophagales bacterium]
MQSIRKIIQGDNTLNGENAINIDFNNPEQMALLTNVSASFWDYGSLFFGGFTSFFNRGMGNTNRYNQGP